MMRFLKNPEWRNSSQDFEDIKEGGLKASGKFLVIISCRNRCPLFDRSLASVSSCNYLLRTNLFIALAHFTSTYYGYTIPFNSIPNGTTARGVPRPPSEFPPSFPV